MSNSYNSILQHFYYSSSKKSQRPLFFLALASLLIFGCKKTTTNTVEPGVVKSYYNIPLQNNVDGAFLFQSQINNNPDLKNTVQMNGLFYDKNGKVIGGGGAASIGIYQFVPDSLQYQATHLSTDSLFGVGLAFNLTPPPNTAVASVTASFYSPTAIYITNNTATPAQINLKPDSSLVITWNADSKNNNGVNIQAQFFTTDSLISAGYPPLIENSIMVSDNGSTILLASFFSKFPKGTMLKLFVGRGNAMIVQSGNYRYYLGGFKNAMEFVNILK